MRYRQYFIHIQLLLIIYLFSFILAGLLLQWVDTVFQGGPAYNYKVQYVNNFTKQYNTKMQDIHV